MAGPTIIRTGYQRAIIILMHRKQFSEEIIKDSFTAYGKQHHFTAQHFLFLSEEERETYKVEDGQFLVRLSFDEEGRTFKVFHHEDDLFRWTTDASTIIVDKESAEVIGSIIDEHYF